LLVAHISSAHTATYCDWQLRSPLLDVSSCVVQATATRAGILYISEGRQWHNMVQSWLQKVAKPYAEKAKWKVSM
jgi:hypothetical protein